MLVWLDQQAVNASVARETGTVTLSVVTEWPEVSYAIASRLISEMTDFNMNTRQSQARAERVFVQARGDSARLELEAAEQAMRDFLQANRVWDNSPRLVFEHEVLQREVTLKQTLLTALAQSLDQARIAERRDTPVITVVSEPFMPPGRDPRRTVMRAAVGFVLGVMLGTLLAVLQEALRRPAEGDPFREDFQQTWDEFVRSIPLVGRSRA